MGRSYPSDPVARPSRASIAYSGLAVILAAACLFAPFVPGVALRPVLGGVLIAATVVGVVVELIQLSQSRMTFWLRVAWALMGAAAGVVLMAPGPASDLSVRLALSAFLAAQGAVLAFCALRARRLRELGGLPLGAEGLLSLAAAAFVALAFPFEQGWVLAAVVAVGLLDYAAALSFLAIAERERERMGGRLRRA